VEEAEEAEVDLMEELDLLSEDGTPPYNLSMDKPPKEGLQTSSMAPGPKQTIG
jgi:hypothetical protein